METNVNLGLGSVPDTGATVGHFLLHPLNLTLLIYDSRMVMLDSRGALRFRSVESSSTRSC